MAEFYKTSPATNITPMPKDAARRAYSMEQQGDEAAGEEDVVTAENRFISSSLTHYHFCFFLHFHPSSSFSPPYPHFSPLPSLSPLILLFTPFPHYSRILEEWDRLTNQSETSSPEHSDNDMEGEEGENSPLREHSPLPLPGTPKFEHQYYHGSEEKDGHSVGGKGGSKGVSTGTGKKASPR